MEYVERIREEREKLNEKYQSVSFILLPSFVRDDFGLDSFNRQTTDSSHESGKHNSFFLYFPRSLFSTRTLHSLSIPFFCILLSLSLSPIPFSFSLTLSLSPHFLPFLRLNRSVRWGFRPWARYGDGYPSFVPTINIHPIPVRHPTPPQNCGPTYKSREVSHCFWSPSLSSSSSPLSSY